MKNIKAYGIIGLGCGMLFLTGCGGSAHTLTCERDYGTGKIKYELKFNDEETELIKVTQEMTVTAPSNVSNDEFDETVEEAREKCKEKDYENCDVSVSGRTVKVKVTGTPKQFYMDEDSTLEEFKEEAEDSGMNCK